MGLNRYLHIYEKVIATLPQFCLACHLSMYHFCNLYLKKYGERQYNAFHMPTAFNSANMLKCWIIMGYLGHLKIIPMPTNPYTSFNLYIHSLCNKGKCSTRQHASNQLRSVF